MTRSLLIFSILFVMAQGKAQDFQGQAVYESKTQINIDLSGRNIPEDRKKRIQERMKQMGERSYVLDFNRTESIFKEEEKLDSPQGGNGGRGRMFMSMMSGGAGGDYYKNVTDAQYKNKVELFGKIFLINDSLPTWEWKLGSESKKIGQYTAYKATAIKQVRRTNTAAMFRRVAARDRAATMIEKEVTVTAWYTPEIPINQGPSDYWGLPGLILEVADDVTTMVCSKITINPQDKVAIKVPKKGKVVSQEEFDAIARKKTQEMRENFRNRGPRGGRQ